MASRFRGGWQIRVAPDFDDKVLNVVGDLVRWDEIRVALDFTLNNDPHIGTRISGNYWAIETDSIPRLCLLYEVDEAKRIVTYDNIVRL